MNSPSCPWKILIIIKTKMNEKNILYNLLGIHFMRDFSNLNLKFLVSKKTLYFDINSIEFGKNHIQKNIITNQII